MRIEMRTIAVILAGLLGLTLLGPAQANRREAEGRIPPPKDCQWAKELFNYKVDYPGFDCFAYGQNGQSSWVVTSVTRGTIEGEARIGIEPFKPGGEREWVSARTFKGRSVEVRVIQAAPHQLIMFHSARVDRGKGKVYVAFREMDSKAIFSMLVRRLGRNENLLTVLLQLGLLADEDRREREAGRSRRQINIDPSAEILLKLALPFLKESIFGCGHMEVAQREALTAALLSTMMKELDIPPVRRMMATNLITNWIAAFEEFLLFDLRNILGDDCARF